MEKETSPHWRIWLSSLALFDGRYYPSQWLLFCLFTAALTDIPGVKDFWYGYKGLLPGFLSCIFAEFLIRQFPAPFKWLHACCKRESTRNWEAWSWKSLVALNCLFVGPSVLFVSSGSWKITLSAVLVAAVFSTFCWVFLSLGESWGKKAGKANFGNSCLFLLLMTAALYVLIYGAIWAFGKHP